jgi:hypothetical protein
MKLNSIEFKEYILSEVKKIAQNEGWNENLETISENVVNSLNESEFELIDPSEWDNKVSIQDNTLKKVNSLNEELKRMRELVDFRNPFFNQK